MPCYLLTYHAHGSWMLDNPRGYVKRGEVARAKLRESFARRLNRKLERCEWFSKSPSRKRVKDREHFNYLVTKYLPKHRGWKWAESVGSFQ